MKILLNWEHVDTSYVKLLTDEELLKQISYLDYVPPNGWGLIAELMKRYKHRWMTQQ